MIALSPAPVATEEGQRYFAAQIAVDDIAAGFTLQPGLPVSVNVKTLDRALIDYLVSPSVDAMSRGFREE